MQIEKQKLLKKKYPSLFRKSTIIDCWDGWFDLIDKLAEELSIDKELKILNIMSSSGLKLTFNKTSNELDKIEESYRLKSLKICEICGKPGKLESIRLLDLPRVCCENHK